MHPTFGFVFSLLAKNIKSWHAFNLPQSKWLSLFYAQSIGTRPLAIASLHQSRQSIERLLIVAKGFLSFVNLNARWACVSRRNQSLVLLTDCQTSMLRLRCSSLMFAALKMSQSLHNSSILDPIVDTCNIRCNLRNSIALKVQKPKRENSSCRFQLCHCEACLFALSFCCNSSAVYIKRVLDFIIGSCIHYNVAASFLSEFFLKQLFYLKCHNHNVCH